MKASSWRKLRSLNMRQIVRRLRPQTINQLLYEHTRASLDEALGRLKVHDQADAVINNTSYQDSLNVERFSNKNLSGEVHLDGRLSDVRECYAVKVDGAIAHESWLFNTVLLPSQFGFPKNVPVIGDCVTHADFRGRHLYPRVLMHIADDVIRDGHSSRIYVLVSPDNKASIRGIERAGFRQLAHLKGLRVAGCLVRKTLGSAML